MSMLVRQANPAGQLVISTNPIPKTGSCTCRNVPIRRIPPPYIIKCTGTYNGIFGTQYKRACSTEFCLLCHQHVKYFDSETGDEFYYADGFFPIPKFIIIRSGEECESLCVECDLYFKTRKFPVVTRELTETIVSRTYYDKCALSTKYRFCRGSSIQIQHQVMMRAREFAFRVRKDPSILANKPRSWH